MSGLKDSELLGAPASSRPNPPEHKEWFSRGYLSHFDLPDLLQSITFRLADSLPQTVLDKMTHELAEYPEARRQRERERRIAAYLDAGHGACWLKDARVAALVENALLHFDGQRYRLLAWCVMPNHVHALVETNEGFPLSKIVHSWKSFTGNQANKILVRSGDFWQREYHDRFIRDDEHYRNAVVYIENNPVKAGLAKTAEAWRYSSAWSHEEKAAGKDAGAPGV
jgi:REP element-mobilizing transposase RayT